MTAAAAGSQEAPARAKAGPAAPPRFDVFVIHTLADEEQTQRLARALEERGVRPWLSEEQDIPLNRWKGRALEVLASLPACALVVGAAGLPGPWGRRELEEAARRKAADARFRFLLVYLPEAEAVPGEALPLRPDAVISFEHGIDAAGLSAIVEALGTTTPPAQPMALSPSVEEATALSGLVTSFSIVRRLLESHDHYAGGAIRPDDLANAPESAARRSVDRWLADVRALYDPRRVPTLHGRLLIDGLARLDRALHERLSRDRALERLRAEITPPPELLLRRKRDAVETLSDQPSDVDELGRAVLAKVLATRLRRVRLAELERHSEDRDETKRRGGPFLLHLYGRWGAGKTSLLNFLREQLETSVRGVDGPDDTRTLTAAVRERFRRRRSPPKGRGERGGNPLDRWIVIDFNAWEHQRIVPPWWWLMAAVSSEGGRALRQIDRPRWLRLKLWDYGWRLRGGIPGLLIVGAGLVIAWFVWRSGAVSSATGFWPSLLKATEGVVKSFSAILALVLTIWGGAKALSRWLLVGSPRAAGTVLAHGNDPLGALSVRFANLVRRLHYPVAIFIDDLDRCQAKYVVELLEGIQTLFRGVPVTYVVAADREWVCQSFADEYKTFCTAVGTPGRPLGHLFLEKTFQLSVSVPALSNEIQRRYLERLLRATSADGSAMLERARREAQKRFQALSSRDEIDVELRRGTPASPLQQQAAAEAAVLRLAEPELEEEAEHLLEPFAPLLEPNPRSMKRLVNAFGIASAVEILRGVAAIGTNTPEAVTAEQLALWTILGLRWPLLADYIADDPSAAAGIMSRVGAPKDAPDWLTTLWTSDDVMDVLAGNAPKVSASLDPAAVAACAGVHYRQPAAAAAP
jgi:hypothetical protein